MPGRVSLAFACNMIAAAVVSLGSLAATAAERVVPYLAPPGVRAEAFPRPERPVAEIVGPSISTEEARDERDEAGQVARLLRLRPGMTVGDIGAGSGYHTVRLARLLGPSGLVVAQDLSPLYLGLLARRVDRLDFRNVKIALGEPHDPRLPVGLLDAAIIVHAYHEIAEPYAFLYNLAPALKAGATLGIVDFDRPISRHGMAPNLLRCELAAAGYREIGFHSLDYWAGEYLAVFSAPRQLERPRYGALDPCSRSGAQ
jgi:ubiquinone/menaquinone biosynthesis C-methylase UbiE